MQHIQLGVIGLIHTIPNVSSSSVTVEGSTITFTNSKVVDTTAVLTKGRVEGTTLIL